MIGMVWGLALAKTKCPYCPVAHHFMLSNEAFQRKLDHQMSLHANVPKVFCAVVSNVAQAIEKARGFWKE